MKLRSAPMFRRHPTYPHEPALLSRKRTLTPISDPYFPVGYSPSLRKNQNETIEIKPVVAPVKQSLLTAS